MFDVFLVDDDDLVRDTILDAIGAEGFSVREADGPDAALASYRPRDGFRLLVTDIDLGTPMDGFALGAELRRRQPRLPVIYISGRPNVFRDRILLEGERSLAKPFRMSDLIRVIRTLFPAPKDGPVPPARGRPRLRTPLEREGPSPDRGANP